MGWVGFGFVEVGLADVGCLVNRYHWVAVIAWERWVPLLSWVTGWINVSGWIALVATGGLLGSQLIQGVISLEDPNYVPER